MADGDVGRCALVDALMWEGDGYRDEPNLMGGFTSAGLAQDPDAPQAKPIGFLASVKRAEEATLPQPYQGRSH